MNKQRIISWTAVALWMILIFYLSAQVAGQSEQLSSGLSQKIMEFIEKVIPSAVFDVNMFNHIVRKNAHFFAYLVLGFLILHALKKSNVRGNSGLIIAVFICVLYAGSDEIHQLFVPGRAGQVKDVVIDSAGACVGILLGWGVGRYRKRSEKKYHL